MGNSILYIVRLIIIKIEIIGLTMKASGFISRLVIYLIVLVSISFFTLLERKVLGYIQLRKGPRKVGILGLVQPFADAIKLFCKESNYPTFSNTLAFLAAPCTGLLLALFLWVLVPSSSSVFLITFRILLFFCVSRFRVYRVLAAG